MRHVRPLIFAALFLSACLSKAQKTEDWLPISQQDWQIKDVPGNTGASAIQLYYSYYKDDNDKFISVYKRVKVLREGGKRYADIEIEVDPGATLKTVAARTIHPDGTNVMFTGKPFEKTIFKRGGIKLAVRTLTLPEVTVGSILECKYTIGLPAGLVDPISVWELQSELFTVKAHFRFRAYQGVVEVPSEWSSKNPHSQVAYAYVNQLDVRLPEKKKGNLMEFEVENVPAFNGEEYMPPADDFKPIVLFYYGGREIASPERYWDQTGTEIAAWIEKFIGDYREIREAAAQAVGSENDAEKKLRRLYTKAQEIRNISYERERSEEELKKEKLKKPANVAEVLARGYGTSLRINCLFAAMARAAGFQANVLLVSDRRQRSFERLVLSTEQIDSTAVQVNLNGKEIVLDPGTRFNPFGLLDWGHTAATALKFSKSGAEFITTPAPQNSGMQRTVRMALGPDGSLKGEIILDLKGEDALQQRLGSLTTDDAGRRKDLEDQVRSWLPQGAAVKLTDVQGWEASDDSLLAHFSVEIPNFASSTGKRLIAPAFLFPTFQKNMFVHEGRIYPIVFPYPFTEKDEVDIKLPEGYSLEAPPYRRKAGLSYAGYEISSNLQDNTLITKRSLRMDGLTFPPEQYDELKNFFTIVKAGDEGQAVFKPQENASAGEKQ